MRQREQRNRRWKRGRTWCRGWRSHEDRRASSKRGLWVQGPVPECSSQSFSSTMISPFYSGWIESRSVERGFELNWNESVWLLKCEGKWRRKRVRERLWNFSHWSLTYLTFIFFFYTKGYSWKFHCLEKQKAKEYGLLHGGGMTNESVRPIWAQIVGMALLHWQ